MDGNFIAKADISNARMEMYRRSREDCKIYIYSTRVLNGTMWVQHKWLVFQILCMRLKMSWHLISHILMQQQATSFVLHVRLIPWVWKSTQPIYIYKKKLVLMLMNTHRWYELRKQSNMFILNLAKSLNNHFSIMSFNSALQFAVLLCTWQAPF